MQDTSPPKNRRGRRMLWRSAVQRRVPTASLRSPAGSTASTGTLRVTGRMLASGPTSNKIGLADRPKPASSAGHATFGRHILASAPRPETKSRVALLRRGSAGRLGIVAHVRSQPALGLVHADSLAPSVVLDLIARDPPDGEVARLRMAEIQPAHARRRQHRERLRQAHPGGARVEQQEELRLLGVVRTGRIAERRADAAEALAQEIREAEPLVGRVPLP